MCAGSQLSNMHTEFAFLTHSVSTLFTQEIYLTQVITAKRILCCVLLYLQYLNA